MRNASYSDDEVYRRDKYMSTGAVMGFWTFGIRNCFHSDDKMTRRVKCSSTGARES